MIILRVKFHIVGIGIVAVSFITVAGCTVEGSREKENSPAAQQNYDEQIQANARRMMEDGKRIFRFDTFGSEDFWGGKLRLHESIAGEKLGGVGAG